MTNFSFNSTAILTSPSERLAFKRRWNDLAHAKKISATDVVLRALLLGQDPLCSFNPVRNAKRLANGFRPYFELDAASRKLAFEWNNREHQKRRLEYAKRWASENPRLQYHVEKALVELEKPLNITQRWGCVLEDPHESTQGLSLNAFMQAQELARSLISSLKLWMIESHSRGTYSLSPSKGGGQ